MTGSTIQGGGGRQFSPKAAVRAIDGLVTQADPQGITYSQLKAAAEELRNYFHGAVDKDGVLVRLDALQQAANQELGAIPPIGTDPKVMLHLKIDKAQQQLRDFYDPPAPGMQQTVISP